MEETSIKEKFKESYVMHPIDACEKYPNLIRQGEDGIFELYADHHILSHLRLCEAYYVENFINQLGLRGDRTWYLEFGIWFHLMMEKFYSVYKQQTDFVNPVDSGFKFQCSDFASYGAEKWNELDLQYFTKQPERFKACAKIGGLTGAIHILTSYWSMYGAGRETLKIIGTELSFGRGKEVPILEKPQPRYNIPFRAYYCGRIDAIGDDGTNAFPVDHKTTNNITPETGRNFSPHEGMEGYTFALSKIFKTFFPNYERVCTKALVNHVQVSYNADYTKRFKRTNLYYSPNQLEEWRMRQIRSFKRIWNLLIEEETPDWNTSTCHDIYNYPCPFRTLHEQDSINRGTIINAHYIQIKPWDYNAKDE